MVLESAPETPRSCTQAHHHFSTFPDGGPAFEASRTARLVVSDSSIPGIAVSMRMQRRPIDIRGAWHF